MNKHGGNFAIRGHQNRIPNKFGRAGHTIHEELFLKLVTVLLGDGRNLLAVYVGYATYYTDSLPYSNERQNISSGFIERNSTGGTSFFTIEPSLRAHKAGFVRSGKTSQGLASRVSECLYRSNQFDYAQRPSARFLSL